MYASGLSKFDIDGQSKVELSYRLAKKYWKQGFGTEIVLAVRDYAFQVLKLPELISLIDPKNENSINIATRNSIKNSITSVKKTLLET